MRPEPSLIFPAFAIPSRRCGLTGESGRDEIHFLTPVLAGEGCEIVPDRSLIQGLVCHPRHEDARAIGFPLDVTNSFVSLSQGELEPEFEPSHPGA
jgi:hypothetical protein